MEHIPGMVDNAWRKNETALFPLNKLASFIRNSSLLLSAGTKTNIAEEKMSENKKKKLSGNIYIF